MIRAIAALDVGDGNPYCWQEESGFTYETCCGVDHNDCFDDIYFTRESCCSEPLDNCWAWSGAYTWDNCCHGALPHGREVCFHNNHAWGLLCCLGTKGILERGVQLEASIRQFNADFVPTSFAMKHGHRINFARTGHDHIWSSYEHFEDSTFDVFDAFLSSTDSGHNEDERRNGKTVWDIGGYIGTTALYMAQTADIEVIVMEPGSISFAALVKNIEANPLVSHRITAVNMALGVNNRPVEMSNRADSGDHVLVSARNMSLEYAPPYPRGGPRYQQTVNMITPGHMLDRYPALIDTEFIKIDAEGAEWFLIPALAPLLLQQTHVFFRRKPRMFVSLHSKLLSREHLMGLCEMLMHVFPYLYEVDSTSSTLIPFDINQLRNASFIFSQGHWGGTDILGVWNEVPVEKREMKKMFF